MYSFNRGNIEGTNSSKFCVRWLCMYVLLCVCEVIVCVSVPLALLLFPVHPGDHHVSKRETRLGETYHDDHHVSKAVLLHALGNAALTRSLRHLVQHAQPNRGHPMWRRAALDALRHYTCAEVGYVDTENRSLDFWGFVCFCFLIFFNRVL